MKRNRIKSGLLGSLIAVFLLLGCSGNQSLQEYYVDNMENPNFLVVDVPASIIKLDEADLDQTQLVALKSLRKLNILAFKKTADNAGTYSQETVKVRQILDNPDFKQLMKLNTKYARGVVKYLGEGDAIDEVVIYGDSQDKGFALIRVLGDDMNPAHFMQLMQALQKADLNDAGLEELTEMLKG